MNIPQQITFLNAIKADRALPVDNEAKELWLKDLKNPLRWVIRPVAQLLFVMVLYTTWLLKRLPLPQFKNHKALQYCICWFCDHFVSYEANVLILRHFATESNILNFVIDNAKGPTKVKPVILYPKSIWEMMDQTFINHDEELFRTFIELEHHHTPQSNPPNFEHWQSLATLEFKIKKRKTQIIDFETAHILFMSLFCFLLTREEYQGAINGFNLDHSLAARIAAITGIEGLSEYAYNKFPLYLVGPHNLTQRFLMHGFFTEHLYSKLEAMRLATGRTNFQAS